MNNIKTMKENNGKTKRETRKTRKENTSKPIRFKQEGGSGGFVSLNIAGYNNCYLAAVIQLLWSIEDFRTELLNISREDIIKLAARDLTQTFLEAKFPESIAALNTANDAAETDSGKFVYKPAVAANFAVDKSSDINNIIALQELYRNYQKTVEQAKKTLVIDKNIKFKDPNNKEITIINQFNSLIKRTDTTQEDASDVLKLLRPFIDYSTNVDSESVNSLFKIFATTTLIIQDFMKTREEQASLLASELLVLEDEAQANAAANADQNLSDALAARILTKTYALEDAKRDIQQPSNSYSIEINPYLLLTTPNVTVIDRIQKGIDNIEANGATVVKVYDENKYVLLYVNRHTNTDDIVNRAKIFIDTYVTIDKNKYKICGCICHIGASANNGHYIYFAYDDNGIISKVISDTIIYDKKYVDHTIKPETHGTIFLYKKILSVEPDQPVPPGKTAQLVKPVQTAQPVSLGKTGKPGNTGKTGKPGNTGKPGKTGPPGKTAQLGKPVQTVPPVPLGNTGNTAQPDEPNERTLAGKLPEAQGVVSEAQRVIPEDQRVVPEAQRVVPEDQRVVSEDEEQEEQSSETIYSNSGENIILGSLLCITIIVSTLMLR